jgi:hypothetical protein
MAGGSRTAEALTASPCSQLYVSTIVRLTHRFGFLFVFKNMNMKSCIKCFNSKAGRLFRGIADFQNLKQQVGTKFS